MRRFLFAVLLVLACETGAAADSIEEAKSALDRGDYAVAVQLLRPLAEQGNASAQSKLGWLYAYGHGVPLDAEEARTWFRRAAEQRHAEAQHSLGLMYRDGQGVPQDYQEALKWFRLAAEQGYAQTQFVLGQMYHGIQGVAQDYPEAVKWYRKAAEQGIAQAQLMLGQMYYGGQGVIQDYQEAMKWYRLAAEQGMAQAQYNLGAMYATRQGIPQEYGQNIPQGYGQINTQEYQEGVKWLRLAAKQGHVMAQSMLVLIYRYGHGVPKDITRAYMWEICVAASMFGDEGQTSLKIGHSVALEMTVAQIEMAQEMARRCQETKFKECD
jgi:TPR repeat protein